MIILKLFYVFLKISLFAVGGAYSFVPLLEKEIVENYQWLTKSEFLDILGMVQIFPGAISIKYSTYVGYKIAGIPGALAANFGNFLGPAVVIMLVVNFYMKYKDFPAVKSMFFVIQLAVVAMIVAVAFKLVSPAQLFQAKSMIFVVVFFALFLYTKIHPALIITIAGVMGILMHYFKIARF